MAGHEASLREYEAVYFRILCIGAMPVLLAATLSCFFTGRGKTWTVMWVNIAATVVNIVLDYCLIFGHWFFPRWGVAGAAIATVASSVFSCVVYLLLFFGRRHRKRYFTASGWRFDRKLFLRLMRYGLPSGAQFMLDILGFALFVTFIGRISAICLAANSMVFQINSLAFMPMIGFSTAVSVLVGRALGEGKPAIAQRSTWSASAITLFYMTAIAAGYWFFPGIFMQPFAAQADPAEFEAIKGTVETLLCFVAIYSVFDTGNLIFSAALKGAGDTRFVMVVSVVLNWFIMVVPTYIAVTFQKGMAGFYTAWTALTVYVIVLAILFLMRFLQGKWKNMRVIETAPTPLPHNMPAVPTVETDKN
jgi:MATE family multidrug resistance protein